MNGAPTSVPEQNLGRNSAPDAIDLPMAKHHLRGMRANRDIFFTPPLLTRWDRLVLTGADARAVTTLWIGLRQQSLIRDGGRCAVWWCRCMGTLGP